MDYQDLLKAVDELNRLTPPRPLVKRVYANPATLQMILDRYPPVELDPSSQQLLSRGFMPAELLTGTRIDFLPTPFLPDGILQEADPPYKLYRLGPAPDRVPPEGNPQPEPNHLTPDL